MSAAELRATYLDEVGRLLQPLTPVERIGVVDAVRTHIDDAFAARGEALSEASAQQILDELGSPEDVAERALAGGAVLPEAAPAAPASPPSTTGSAAGAAGPATPARAQSRPPVRPNLADLPAMDWPEEPIPKPPRSRPWVALVAAVLLVLGSFFLMFLIPAVLLMGGIALLWTSPLWNRRERLIGTIVPVLTLAPFLPLLVQLTEIDGAGRASAPTVPLLALLVLAVLGAAACVWIAVRGLRAARRIAAESPEMG